MQAIDIIVGSFLSMSLTYIFVMRDRTRIPTPWRQRGWNAASTGVAILNFSPFCIVAHFWVTRRSIRGLLQGVLALVFLLVVQIGLTEFYQQVGPLAFALTLLFQPIVVALIPTIVALAFV